jgi:lipase chaperone LimK
MSVADLYAHQFSEQGLAQTQIEKRAAELLHEVGVEDLGALTEEQAQQKLAELQQHVGLQKQAAVDIQRGDFMAQGFLARLQEEGVDLPGLHATMSKVAAALDGKKNANGTTAPPAAAK